MLLYNCYFILQWLEEGWGPCLCPCLCYGPRPWSELYAKAMQAPEISSLLDAYNSSIAQLLKGDFPPSLNPRPEISFQRPQTGDRYVGVLDKVGIALKDFSVLKLVAIFSALSHRLRQERG